MLFLILLFNPNRRCNRNLQIAAAIAEPSDD